MAGRIRLFPNADGSGRKIAMPDGQFLIFEREDSLVILKGNGWLDLSLLIDQNNELLQSVRLLQDGEPVEIKAGVVLGDGAGNFYEVAPEGPSMMALVGFMTKDLEGLLPVPSPTKSEAEQRQADRWRACIDAGLSMPKDTYDPYPKGITQVAKSLGIKRQSLREDLDKHRERVLSK